MKKKMTKKEKATAELLQRELCDRGLQAEVGFTRAGYIRLTVSRETAKQYSCIATLQARAAEILKTNFNNFYTTIK